jgi:hypothetical protein
MRNFIETFLGILALTFIFLILLVANILPVFLAWGTENPWFLLIDLLTLPLTAAILTL